MQHSIGQLCKIEVREASGADTSSPEHPLAAKIDISPLPTIEKADITPKR
jgi:hypothetical protein